MRVMCGACAVLLAGCAGTQSAPVPVRGDLMPMAGEWRGSYESPALGRSGSILFTLEQGEDHAHGDVVMVPSGRNTALMPARRGLDNEVISAQAITIRFVRVRGDTVSGTLTPYTDPDCDCTAVTSFRGVVHGDMIRGLFETRRALGSATGTWVASRNR